MFPNLMRRVVQSHLGPVHEEGIDLERSVLDLLIGFLELAENRASLWVVIRGDCLQHSLSVLVALVDYPHHTHQSGFLLLLGLEVL